MMINVTELLFLLLYLSRKAGRWGETRHERNTRRHTHFHICVHSNTFLLIFELIRFGNALEEGFFLSLKAG